MMDHEEVGLKIIIGEALLSLLVIIGTVLAHYYPQPWTLISMSIAGVAMLIAFIAHAVLQVNEFKVLLRVVLTINGICLALLVPLLA